MNLTDYPEYPEYWCLYTEISNITGNTTLSYVPCDYMYEDHQLDTSQTDTLRITKEIKLISPPVIVGCGLTGNLVLTKVLLDAR